MDVTGNCRLRLILYLHFILSIQPKRGETQKVSRTVFAQNEATERVDKVVLVLHHPVVAHHTVNKDLCSVHRVPASPTTKIPSLTQEFSLLCSLMISFLLLMYI